MKMRKIVEDWGKATPKISYYQYMFNLAEYSAPYPTMHQMIEEQPIIYANNIKYWQPEGMTNLDQILPGHYLSNRMAWNPKSNPVEILDEFFNLGLLGVHGGPLIDARQKCRADIGRTSPGPARRSG